MTASEKPAKEPGFPSVTSLITDTLVIVIKLRSELYGYAAWLLIPCFILLIPAFVSPDFADFFNGLGNGLFFALSIWLMAAITLSVTTHLKRKSDATDVTEDVGSVAWRATPKLFWVAILTAAIEFIGFVLFIVPGILFTVWFVFAPFEIILQGKGVMEALKESKKLSEGRFFQVLIPLIVGAIIFGLGSLIISLPVLLTNDPATYNPPAWLQASLSAVDILFFPFIVSYELMLYFALKSE